MKRRTVLAMVGGSTTALAGCTASVLGCDSGDTTIEEHNEDGSQTDDDSLLEEDICIAGEVDSIDYQSDSFVIDDGTGTALIAAVDDHVPSNRPDLDEGDCVSVCGGQGDMDGDGEDIYIHSAQWYD